MFTPQKGKQSEAGPNELLRFQFAFESTYTRTLCSFFRALSDTDTRTRFTAAAAFELTFEPHELNFPILQTQNLRPNFAGLNAAEIQLHLSALRHEDVSSSRRCRSKFALTSASCTDSSWHRSSATSSSRLSSAKARSRTVFTIS